MKKWLLAWLIMALAACAGTGRTPTQVEVYDFGLPSTAQFASGQWSSVALEVRAPNWIDNTSVNYRLLYDDPLKWRTYSASRWAGPPSQLLAQRLRQQLTLAGSGAHGVRCLLRIDLQAFVHVFVDPQRSRGEVHVQAGLFGADRRVLGEKKLAIGREAPSVDAPGGVFALVSASDELAQQLAQWLNDAEKHGRLNGCLAQAVTDR